MAMDIKRDPKILRKKRIRQIILLSLAGVAVVVISVAVSRLKPAAPSVPGTNVWPGTVARGSMTREVHGAGTLVPEDIRWIVPTTSGRVEKIVLKAGADVKPGTVILILSNPDLQQQYSNADLALKTSEAQLINQQTNLKNQRAALVAGVANAQGAFDLAAMDVEANKKLAGEGIISALVLKQKEESQNQAKRQLELAKDNLKSADENLESQLAPARSDVNAKKSQLAMYASQLEDLRVKSTITGRLQVVNAEEGAQVGPSTQMARVADPTNLKAQVRISETQTKDLLIGQHATIDTRNGIVKGHVARIDPAAVGGTVGVDVILDEALPAGARQDMSVDGTIELQRLENVLYVQHPAFGQENSAVTLFKISADGTEATRVQVKFGRASVNFIEIVEGLQVGDKVILSDMSAYDSYDRIRLN
jgi:HlyD family secretion protein